MDVERYAFETIDRLRKIQDTAGVVIELNRVMRDFGFESVIVTGLPQPGQPMTSLVLSSNWPDGWTQRYLGNNYDKHDPVAQKIRGTLTPFRWNSVMSTDLTLKQKRVMYEAGEFNLNDGLAIPIHDFTGLEAAVSFGTSKYTHDSRAEAALHLISLYIYEGLRKKRPVVSGGGLTKSLSPRERECTQWLAEGKTAWEIGKITNLSEGTVKKYLHSAARKTDARTRAQLVAKCLREKMIA